MELNKVKAADHGVQEHRYEQRLENARQDGFEDLEEWEQWKFGQLISKNRQETSDVYAPDRPLPQDKNGVPLPDVDAPHTQLGVREGSKGPYPKAREFDSNGTRLRDIEFTDHGRSHDHPCPHQHVFKDNSNGGTRSKEDPTPLPNWRY